MVEEHKVRLTTDNALDYASDSTSTPWTDSLFECLLQVSEGLNVTVDIIYNLQNLANNSLNQLSDRELYLYLLNSSVWGEVNSTFWDTSGGTRLTACLVPSPVDRPYLLPWWQQLTWTLAFGSMLLVAVGGNAIVMWIVIAHRRMRTVTNYFLVNLSGADLCMSVFNCMFNFIYMLHSDWPFGSVYCTISNFMANVTIAASVFTLMAISFDRYIAIVRPLKPRMSKSEARHVIIIIWLSSMTLAVPCLLYSTTLSIRYKNDEIRRGCILLWPDGETSFSYREYVYNTVFFTTTYVLPMLVMLVSYSLIGCELWGSHSIGELTDRQASSIKSKRRVVRMFIVIVVIFMLCWLPQQGFFLYQYHNNQVLDSEHIQHIYLGFYWLAMANAMINPIVYYWMNARFRSYFREVVLQCYPGRSCCCCCVKSIRYLDSPHLVHRRHDSVDRMSRSRSDVPLDVNAMRRNVPAGGSVQHDRLFVYSSKSKVNARDGPRNTQYSSQRDGGTRSTIPLREMNYTKPVDGEFYRKPLKAEQESHRNQYLSDQNALRIRVQQAPSTFTCLINTVKRNQEDTLPMDEQKPQVPAGDIEMSWMAPNCYDRDSVAAIVSDVTPTGPSPKGECHVSQSSADLLLVPIISKTSLTGPCSSSSLLRSNVKHEKVNEFVRVEKEIESEQLYFEVNNVREEKVDIASFNCVPRPGGSLSVTITSPEEQVSRNVFLQEDSSEDNHLTRTLEHKRPERKSISGNMVHEAIEETLNAVMKRSYVRDTSGKDTRNLKRSPENILKVSREIML